MGYTKLFNEIVMSTVWREPDHIRIVWITMLALKDRYHKVNASLPGLADAAKVSMPQCEEAIKRLESYDKYSRSQENEGRRIEKCDGGWFVLNGEKYRNKLNQDERREYNRIKQQEYRDNKKIKTEERPCTSHVQKDTFGTHTDTDTDTDKTTNNNGQTKAFDLFWEAFPRKVKKKRAREVWMAKKLDCVINELLSDVANRLANHAPWKNGYIPHPTTYLNGELWNDEIEKEDLVQVKKGNGKHLVPSYKDGSALEAYGKSIDKLPKRTESYYQYWQRLCVHAEQEGAHET